MTHKDMFKGIGYKSLDKQHGGSHYKKFKIQLLTTNTNVKEIYKQAIKFKVKNVIVEDKVGFSKYKYLFLKYLKNYGR